MLFKLDNENILLNSNGPHTKIIICDDNEEWLGAARVQTSLKPTWNFFPSATPLINKLTTDPSWLIIWVYILRWPTFHSDRPII